MNAVKLITSQEACPAMADRQRQKHPSPPPEAWQVPPEVEEFCRLLAQILRRPRAIGSNGSNGFLPPEEKAQDIDTDSEGE